jgi:hypothetical protein
MGAIVQLGERLVGHFAVKKKSERKGATTIGSQETCQTLRDHSAKKKFGVLILNRICDNDYDD